MVRRKPLPRDSFGTQHPDHMAHLCSALLSLLLLLPFSADAQWEPIQNSGSYYSVCVHDGALFAGRFNELMRMSSDHGDSWTTINDGITNDSNWWLSSVGDALYCGTQFGDAFRLDDGSSTWSGIGQNSARGFAAHNDTLYACTWYSSTVSWSVNGGATWTPTAALTGTGGLWPMISVNGYLFVGRQGGGVHRLASSTGAWTAVNNGLPTSPIAYALEAIDGELLMGGTTGVYRSTDNGANWTTSSQGLTGTVYALHARDSLVFAGLDGGGVLLSLDSGHTWSSLNAGILATNIVAFASDDLYLYAGTLGGGLMRFPFSELPLAIGSKPAASLEAALTPNPLVPGSTLRLRLKESGSVTVTVLDAMGRTVLQQAYGHLPQGLHLLPFNPAGLAPGEYACMIQAGDARMTVKAVLER